MTSARERFTPVLVILAAIVAIWYAGTYALNAPFQRDLDRRAGETPRRAPGSSSSGR